MERGHRRTPAHGVSVGRDDEIERSLPLWPGDAEVDEADGFNALGADFVEPTDALWFRN